MPFLAYLLQNFPGRIHQFRPIFSGVIHGDLAGFLSEIRYCSEFLARFLPKFLLRFVTKVEFLLGFIPGFLNEFLSCCCEISLWVTPGIPYEIFSTIPNDLFLGFLTRKFVSGIFPIMDTSSYSHNFFSRFTRIFRTNFPRNFFQRFSRVSLEIFLRAFDGIL